MASKLSGPSVEKRPKSAIPFRVSYQREHRLQDNELLNGIRNDIQKVFSQQNKSLKQVKDLTAGINPIYKHRIDRLCIQYSICANPKRQKRLSEDIDVEFITKRYVRAKSKEKKKEQQRTELRRSIGETSRRYAQIEPEEFFQFNRESLRKMQRKAARNDQKNQLDHPYIALYQKSQEQTLAGLAQRNTIALQQLSEHPIYAEPDDWEKQTRGIKQIYSGVRLLRASTLRQKQNKRGEEVDSFYIT